MEFVRTNLFNMNNEELLRFWKSLLPKMESLENSLSIVVQGPLHERLNESLPHYIKIVEKLQHIVEFDGKVMGEVVVSYWDNDNEKIIKNFKEHDAVKLVKNHRSKIPEYIHKTGSRGAAPWILQNYTTLKGIESSTGNICIKVRSDEIYPRLDVFYKKIKENLHSEENAKFFTSDIFFRPDKEEKFHISDHIIGAVKCFMKSAFETSIRECKNKRILNYSFPEQLICHSILRSRGIKTKDYKSKEIMKNNFEIVPINTMLGSIWTCSYRKYDKLKSQEAGWLQDIKNI